MPIPLPMKTSTTGTAVVVSSPTHPPCVYDATLKVSPPSPGHDSISHPHDDDDDDDHKSLPVPPVMQLDLEAVDAQRAQDEARLMATAVEAYDPVYETFTPMAYARYLVIEEYRYLRRIGQTDGDRFHELCDMLYNNKV